MAKNKSKKKSSKSGDSEAIEVSDSNQPSDLSPVVVGAMKKLPGKLLIYIFVIYLFLSSDVFITRILNNLDGAVGMSNMPTTYGTVVTGILLVLFTTVAHCLIQSKVI